MDFRLPDRTLRAVLAVFGSITVVYCVLLLAYVATAPDVRLRVLLVDEPTPDAAGVPQPPAGIIIRKTPGLVYKGALPETGDRLIRINNQRISNALDYLQFMVHLRSMETPPGGWMLQGGNPLEHDMPRLVQEEGGPRWVEVEFVKPGQATSHIAWLAIQGIPLDEVGMTLVWFILQLGIFSIGAVAFWRRPFDRPARLFFVMCIVTLGAFVGGFHWWAIAGHFLLNIPFVIYAVLVPVVTLHFFQIYPRVKPAVAAAPRATLVALYSIPVAAILCFLVAESVLGWLGARESMPPAERSSAIVLWLTALKNGVYLYLGLAAVYFLGILVSLVHAVWTTRNPVEHNQVKWILWAGLVATGFIAYTLVLAVFSRTDFALGGGRWPMFLASLLFMCAYAVGIIRYKLMLADQIVTRGMWYYVLSWGATFALAVGVAVCAGLAVGWKLAPTRPQLWLLTALFVVAVAMMIWLRDVWQRWVDRRFFREKYQLDKALQRINRSVGGLADTQLLSQRMAGSCRDVLQAERVAIYLREGRTANFRLIAAEGPWASPRLQFTGPPEFLQALAAEPTLQFVPAASRDSLSPVQSVLRVLQADLIQALEIEGVLTGLVVLGARQTGGMYSAEDVTFLTAMGQITGVALHCTKIHQDLGRLNEELRLKADRIEQQKQQILMLQTEISGPNASDASPAAEAIERELIKGSSPALVQVLDVVRKAGPTDTSVLIRGESGTGKELLAQAFHRNSSRRNGPLVSVHCAALSAGLLESELFGHVKGAFTGAHGDKQGRFELANGGTLFLDEIGDISLETQVKLLRVLQERSFEPVGGSQTIHVDVRLVAATHRNLEQLIAQGRFREDLYYRLNVVSVTLPPLRERQNDIFELAIFFLKGATARTGKRITHFEEAAIDALLHYAWPGNIRELENVIERAVVLAEGDAISLEDLPPPLRQTAGASAAAEPSRPTRRRKVLKPTGRLSSGSVATIPASLDALDSDAERRLLVETLARCQGNKAEAARLLGLPRSTFFSKLKKYSITP